VVKRVIEPSFVHLRLHSEYSVVDGIVRLDEAVEAAVADRMPALALTDLSNVFGLVKFYTAARARGVKPIAGCDLSVTNESDRDKPSRLLLLCQNHAGYLKLCELLTRAYRSNRYRGRAEIRKSWFSETGTEGLIALSGAHLGDVGQALIVDNTAAATQLAREWQSLFPGRYYIELQRIGAGAVTSGAAQVPLETYVRRAAQLAADLGLPPVATHPVQFVRPDDFRAHEARVCISEGYILSDQRRPKSFHREQYFKTQAEMAELFDDIPAALANSVEIAKRCNLKLTLGKSQLPVFPTPQAVTLDDYLRTRSAEGLAERLRTLYPDDAKREHERSRYVSRLDFELSTIVQMGFAGYFLIVADFINWAKRNGVPVGPGRGSGAGSLVAYSLGITDLDPLRYNLLFERFLNPERVSMPDFDIDFCQDGRDRVIEYVKTKFGAESVSQIATFGTMAAKAVVRDVGRVLDLGYNFCDQLAKLIPFQPGKHITLADAREMEPQLKEREKNEEEVAELLALAEKLEGLTRNVGMHAGGVLIAPGKLTDFCPLYIADGSEAAVSQYDKDDVEAVGLVKFDFLGLTTLTILDWTVRYIRRMSDASGELGGDGGGGVSGNEAAETRDEKYESFDDLANIPLDDPAAYRIFSSANTSAVFQFESRGMRDMLKRARPDRFGDIIALVALYRPGPMDLIPSFCERKHGRERVIYPDPRVEPILSETYGIMVYQEQVMQMAQIIGGYSLGGADLLRRAMGKKKPEEMAQHRQIFREGAAKNGLTQARADELFDLMEKFAGYGFNKSHAAAYALVAYQTAYMKAHHAAAFMAANMSAVMADTDKVQQLFDDAVQNGLSILPPDVNASEYRFLPLDRSSIRYGLGAIKGTGEAAIGHIIEERSKGGAFRDLFDFCKRVDNRMVNRRTVESLVRAGAFDTVNDHRASLLATVGIALESAEQASRAANQVSLFGDLPEEGPGVSCVDVPRWHDRERLQNEKLALGYYLSGHPFKSYERELSSFISTRLDQLTPQPQPVLLAGIIHSQRIQMTRRGRMAVLLLDDGHARIELTVFNELFEQHRHWLKEDQLLIVEGKVAHDDFSGSLRISAEDLFDLQTARNRFARGIRIICNGTSSGQKLKEVLAPYRSGKCPVQVVYYNKAAACEIELGEAWRVNLRDELIETLHGWLQPENVQIVYQPAARYSA
jgi:DNA polymerase-3 subunit alpha